MDPEDAEPVTPKDYAPSALDTYVKLAMLLLAAVFIVLAVRAM